jgi:hypothetical protein
VHFAAVRSVHAASPAVPHFTLSFPLPARPGPATAQRGSTRPDAQEYRTWWLLKPAVVGKILSGAAPAGGFADVNERSNRLGGELVRINRISESSESSESSCGRDP